MTGIVKFVYYSVVTISGIIEAAIQLTGIWWAGDWATRAATGWARSAATIPAPVDKYLPLIALLVIGGMIWAVCAAVYRVWGGGALSAFVGGCLGFLLVAGYVYFFTEITKRLPGNLQLIAGIGVISAFIVLFAALARTGGTDTTTSPEAAKTIAKAKTLTEDEIDQIMRERHSRAARQYFDETLERSLKTDFIYIDERWLSDLRRTQDKEAQRQNTNGFEQSGSSGKIGIDGAASVKGQVSRQQHYQNLGPGTALVFGDALRQLYDDHMVFAGIENPPESIDPSDPSLSLGSILSGTKASLTLPLVVPVKHRVSQAAGAATRYLGDLPAGYFVYLSGPFKLEIDDTACHLIYQHRFAEVGKRPVTIEGSISKADIIRDNRTILEHAGSELNLTVLGIIFRNTVDAAQHKTEPPIEPKIAILIKAVSL